MQQNTWTTVCWSTSYHIWHPLKDLGSCYCDTHPTMEQLSSTHQQWFHIPPCMETPLWMQCQSSWHCPKWHNCHTAGSDKTPLLSSTTCITPHLHHACSPHLLHLQHWQPRWNRLQLFLPCQLFRRMPSHQCLQHLMPHLCSHGGPAMPAWHQDAWSRRSRNSWPRLSTDLVIIMCHCIHPQ